MEYIEDKSKTDENYFRLHEFYECWGFEKIGAPLALVRSPMTATSLSNLERRKRNWNIIETKCI